MLCDIMRRQLATAMALLGLLVATAGAHSLWVEAEDTAEVGDVLEVYSFFGHATSATGMYVPLMDSTYLLAPNGEKLNLSMDTGSWLPGYGKMNYASAEVALYWPGDYVFASQISWRLRPGLARLRERSAPLRQLLPRRSSRRRPEGRRLGRRLPPGGDDRDGPLRDKSER